MVVRKSTRVKKKPTRLQGASTKKTRKGLGVKKTIFKQQKDWNIQFSNDTTHNNFKSMLVKKGINPNTENIHILKKTSQQNINKPNINPKFNELEFLLLIWGDMIHDANNTLKNANGSTNQQRLKNMTLTQFIKSKIATTTDNNSIQSRVTTLIGPYNNVNSNLITKNNTNNSKPFQLVVDNGVYDIKVNYFSESSILDIFKKKNEILKLTEPILNRVKLQTQGLFLEQRIPYMLDQSGGISYALPSSVFKEYVSIATLADGGFKLKGNWSTLKGKTFNPYPLEFKFGETKGRIFIKKIELKKKKLVQRLGFVQLSTLGGFKVNKSFPIGTKSAGGLGKFFGDFAQILYALAYKFNKRTTREEVKFGGRMAFATGDKMAQAIYLFMAEQLGREPFLLAETGQSSTSVTGYDIYGTREIARINTLLKKLNKSPRSLHYIPTTNEFNTNNNTNAENNAVEQQVKANTRRSERRSSLPVVHRQNSRTIATKSAAARDIEKTLQGELNKANDLGKITLIEKSNNYKRLKKLKLYRVPESIEFKRQELQRKPLFNKSSLNKIEITNNINTLKGMLNNYRVHTYNGDLNNNANKVRQSLRNKIRLLTTKRSRSSNNSFHTANNGYNSNTNNEVNSGQQRKKQRRESR